MPIKKTTQNPITGAGAPAITGPAAQTKPEGTADAKPGALPPPPTGAQDVAKANAGGGGMNVGIPGLAMATAQANATKKGNLFALREGAYPGAVGLDVVLAQAAASGQGKAAVQKIVHELKTTTGIEPPAALVNAALANPARVADLFVLTPTQMSAGIDALNVAYDAGKLPALPAKPERLADGFDLGGLNDVDIARPQGGLKELSPGLLQGDLPNPKLSDAQAKRNMVVAEVFDRLADNGDKHISDRFEMKYNGGMYTRLDTLVGALAKNGHELEVSFEHRVANFANLKTKAPDGTVLDVPAALLIDTGFTKDGEKAILPAVHSEMVVRIKPGPNTKPGTEIDATVKWFQGISGTGFFPAELFGTPPWCGAGVSGTLEGKDAKKAIEIAGLTSDVINESAKNQDLAVGGYGATGVCNDSVAVVQQVMTGSTAAYPLLKRDATLYAELKSRLADGNHRDDPEYRSIKKAIDVLPNDTKANDSAKFRARVGGLPWAAGAEPFEHVVTARKVLAE